MRRRDSSHLSAGGGDLVISRREAAEMVDIGVSLSDPRLGARGRLFQQDRRELRDHN